MPYGIRNAKLTAAVTIALAFVTSQPGFGQQSSSNGTGLNALDDQALLMELAGRRMNGLLDHAFDAKKIPEQQRLALMALPAIQRLADPNNPPGELERRQLISQIAAGGDRVIAQIDDPAILMEQASALIKFGVEPDVNLMEYWGETPKVQNRMRPVIETVMKMLDKAITTGKTRRDALEQQIAKARNERTEQQWTEADQLVTMAEYTRAMVTYNQAMAVPGNARGVTQRAQLADGAIQFLEGYDSPDSGVQASVRNRLAKLLMTKREYGQANDLFETVVSGQIDGKTKIDPPATPAEQYESRYFSVVCELLQGDTTRAAKGQKDLEGWQKETYLPAVRKDFASRTPAPKAEEAVEFEKAVSQQLDAASQMLLYRIAMKERDKAKDPAAKKAAEDRGFGVLMALSEKQPELRPIIAEQIIEMMGDDVDLKKAEVLILQALVSRGAQAADAITPPAKPDAAVQKQVDQAIAAAREVIDRKDPKITDTVRNGMAIQVPLLLEKLGQNIPAANAFMDYIQKKQGNERNIKAAFERAGLLLTTLPAAERETDAYAKAWERFLPIAVDQFDRREFAFDLARRLRAQNPPKFEQAIKYYRMVPVEDKRLASARYNEMNTLTDWIYATGNDGKPLLNADQRELKSQEALKITEDVRRLTSEALKTAKPADQPILRSRIAGVTITEAELAVSGAKPDWARSLKVLEGFEEQAKGLDNESALNKRAMEIRVAGHSALNQFDKAAEVLITLLRKEQGGRAAAFVLDISRRLRDEYDKAVAEGNKELADQRINALANLSGALVKWAAETKNPNLYRYKVYDADTQRLYGASLTGDQRAAQLKKSMQLFETMRTPENVAAYKEWVAAAKKENPQDKTDPEQPDPAVALGMALVSYDLQDWKTAAAELRRLRYSNKLGTRNRTEIDAKSGEARAVPNDQYWEAMYKFYDAVDRWSKAEPDNADAKKELEAVKTLLRRDYVAGPDEVGGVKQRDNFERLRKELIPDLDLEQLRNAAPSTQPTTEPVEPVAAQ